MSAIDLDALRKLASLARVRLEDDELRRLAPEFERILEAFGTLARADLGTPAEAPELPAHARADEPLPSLGRDALLAGAPQADEGFFVVPKTIGSAR
ncbi:MAG: Asp-tRNA(Asn)/Glu-tRNA(Gln) amidotransferase subunit GatC [Planctomycetes bacterium]|nr:Asp-tRNA(Asn)/Glu-tRNA(Gln) amidotransferase subunit GatC [Planctomycetota bacterium]